MSPNILLEQAIVALKTAQVDSARMYLCELLASAPVLGDRWLLVAKLAQKMGEVDLAVRAANLFSDCHANESHKQLITAGIMAELGQIKPALIKIELLQNTLSYDVSLQHFIASARLQLGDLDVARETFRELLTRRPSSGQSWLSFSALTQFNQPNTELAFIQQAATSIQNTDSISQACYQYALGKAYFDCDEVELAWRAYQRGATLMQAQQRYDGGHARKLVDALITSFKSESFTQLGRSLLETPAPIFVLGWPRSGTTLVEHLLCSHSDVIGGGEIDLVQKSTVAMGGMGCSHANHYQSTFNFSHQAWDKLATRYHYLAAQRFGQQGRIVDKTLNSSRYLGLIAHMFPSSPIICLQREPMDAALSCFRTFFSGHQPWSWSLTNIAQHFRHEDLLFKHWRLLLQDRILVVPYEELVKEPSHWQKTILQFCGLAQECSVDTFYQTDRVVTTSSTVQVRQAIHQNSVAGARQLAHHMDEFKASYQQLNENIQVNLNR